MSTPHVVNSTADLTPSGVGGYAKAIWAGIAAGLTTLGTALTDGVITTLEWVGVASAVVATAGGAYWLSNKVEPVSVVPEPDPILGVVAPPNIEGNTPPDVRL